jgi:6-phosphogluconolactonase
LSDAEIVVLPDAETCATAAAERIAATLAESAAERGRAQWATTGGSTPAPIYRDLATPPRRDTVPWELVELWWGDDRFVPIDHPLSNAKIADDALLEIGALSGTSGTGGSGADVLGGRTAGAPIPAENVHPIPTTIAIGEGRDPAWAAARYAETLRAAGLPEQGGWPVFDLVLLGIGPDGHVLSVFPGSDAFDRDELVLAIPAPTHVEPHVPRVTLNPAILEVARRIIVVCHGASKAPILAKVLGPERDPRRWPAQLAVRRGATWLLDEAAAGRLR